MTNMTSPTDAVLIAQVRGGDMGAFEALVQRHLSAVQAVALAATPNRADADDVVQETFITALQSLAKLRQPERLRPWLLGIARNVAKRYNRAFMKNERLKSEVKNGASVTESDPERNEAREIVREGVAALKTDFREVIALHYFAGMSPEDIGESLGISRDAAYKRLQRARQELGEVLLKRLEPVRDEAKADTAQLAKRITMAVTAAGGLSALAGRSALAASGSTGLVGLVTSPGGMAALGGLLLISFIAGMYATLSAPPAEGAAVTRESSQSAQATGSAGADLGDTESAAVTQPILLAQAAPDTGGANDLDIMGVVQGPNGQPVGGAKLIAEILLESERVGAGAYIVACDDSGKFRIEVSVGGNGPSVVEGRIDVDRLVHVEMLEYKPVVLRLTPTRILEGRVVRGTAVDVLPGNKNVVLDHLRGYQISGKVVAANTGAPIPNAEIGLLYDPPEFRGRRAGISYTASVDQHGRFTIESDRDSVSVFARAEGYAPGYAQLEDLQLGDARRDVVVPIELGRVLYGIVVDEYNQPVPEAAILAGEGHKAFTTSVSDPHTVSDDQGLFYIDNVASDMMRVSAVAKDGRQGTVAIPDAGGEVVIQVYTGATLTGYVYDKGEPQAGGNVCLEDSQFRIHYAKTDADGRYRFENMTSGPAKLSFGYLYKLINLHDGENRDESIDFADFTGKLEIITLQDGEPITTVSDLNVYGHEFITYYYKHAGQPGRLVYEGLPSGPFKSEIYLDTNNKDGAMYLRGTLSPGEHKVMTANFRELGHVFGNVQGTVPGWRNAVFLRDGDEALAPPDGSIHNWFLRELRLMYNVEVDANGNYEFTRIQPGVYTLLVTAIPEASPEGMRRALGETVIIEVLPNSENEVNFTLSGPRQ